MKLSEIIDISALESLCRSISSFTGIATAVLDTEGNILVQAGWNDICRNFHRANPVTAARCRESDTMLAGKLMQGESYNVYKCRNGLVDVAVKLIVDGEHIANFYAGQFLMEKPDLDFFARQADDLGFDKDAYILALKEIPVLSSDYIKKLMDFLVNVIRFVGQSGIAKKKVEDIRQKLIEELRESETEVRKLSGLIPICSSCKKIRNDKGYWEQIENYVSEHSEAGFSHSICPECARKIYPQLKL